MKKVVLLCISVVFAIIILFVGAFTLLDGEHTDSKETKSHVIENSPKTFKAADGKVYVEYKQYDPRWKNEEYWGMTMERRGCGITAMAILLSGYGEKVTPKDLQKKYYPVMNYDNMRKDLLENYNVKSEGFFYDKENLSEKKIIKHLKSNKPLIVCVWTENGKNIWTKYSHYLVLLAADDENNIYVANPNGKENGPSKNGWYPASQVVPYLAKVLYIEE